MKHIHVFEDFEFYNECLSEIECETLKFNNFVFEDDETNDIVKSTAKGMVIGGIIGFSSKFILPAIAGIGVGVLGAATGNPLAGAAGAAGFGAIGIYQGVKRGLKWGLVSGAVFGAAKALQYAYKDKLKASNSGDSDKIHKAKLKYEAAHDNLENEREKAKAKYNKLSPDKRAAINAKADKMAAQLKK